MRDIPLSPGERVVSMIQFRGTLYVALQTGVYRLMQDHLVPVLFKKSMERTEP